MTNTSDPNNLDRADVRIPPPLIYIAGFVLGLLIEKAFPVLVLPKALSRVAALPCVALGVISSMWSIGLFRWAGTSVNPLKPTKTLVVTGPYQFTRNPMYLGLVCLYIGLPLVWRILVVDSAAPFNCSHSILCHRSRGAIPGAKIWRSVSQVQSARATVDLIEGIRVPRLHITLLCSAPRKCEAAEFCVKIL